MPSTIVWRPEYCIGIAEMDAQHQAIFECLLALEKAVTSNDPWRSIAYYLKQLRNSLEEHLIDEEILLRTARFAELSHHVSQHESLMAALKELETGLRTQSTANHLLGMFEAWFVKHVLGNDAEYAAYLTNEGSQYYAAWKRSRRARAAAGA